MENLTSLVDTNAIFYSSAERALTRETCGVFALLAPLRVSPGLDRSLREAHHCPTFPMDQARSNEPG
jgi:hypothetical protein